MNVCYEFIFVRVVLCTPCFFNWDKPAHAAMTFFAYNLHVQARDFARLLAYHFAFITSRYRPRYWNYIFWVTSGQREVDELLTWSIREVTCDLFKVAWTTLKLPWPLCRFLVDHCPAGFFSGGHLGSCYRVFPTAVNISTAKAACTSMYSKARLVSIESDAEFDFLRRHYQYLQDNEGKCKMIAISLIHLSISTQPRRCCNRNEWFRGKEYRTATRQGIIIKHLCFYGTLS